MSVCRTFARRAPRCARAHGLARRGRRSFRTARTAPMAAKKFTVFLSAVSNEFGKVRDRIAADLRSRGLTVKVQSDFRAEADADTVLALLHNYIRDCDAVVCVV